MWCIGWGLFVFFVYVFGIDDEDFGGIEVDGWGNWGDLVY